MVETQVTYGVVAHVARKSMADKLISRLGAVSHFDDGSLGSNANHDLVWREASRDASDWVCILEDDAVISDSFESDLCVALSNAPRRSVIGLYVGGERPPQWQHRVLKAAAKADAAGAAWLSCDTLLWGVGVALPVELVGPMLSTVEYSDAPYDFRLGRWAILNRLPVYYPWPSILDHSDPPTLIDHKDGAPRDRPRVAIRTGKGGTNSKAVKI